MAYMVINWIYFVKRTSLWGLDATKRSLISFAFDSLQIHSVAKTMPLWPVWTVGHRCYARSLYNGWLKNKKGEAPESTSLGWWSIADSNRLPRHCQCRALPDELIPLVFQLRCKDKRSFGLGKAMRHKI